MISKKLFALLSSALLIPFIIFSQTTPIRNNYNKFEGIPHLKIEREMIYVPGKDWAYSHHASITHFKNKFIAIWSNGIKDEDAPGQRVVFATSTDFINWSPVKVLALPKFYNKDSLNVLTAAGFHIFKDTLVAYFGSYSPYKTNTHLWAKTSTDGEHWSNAIDMKVPVNPNHGPEAITGGRLIISGNFTFPYTDDPSGLSGWKMSSFYADSLYKEDNPNTFYSPAEKNNLPPLCEGSFYETKDKTLHALLRVTGKGWQGKLWLTESIDQGQHWSFPLETSFTDNDSKFHFGQLPNKQFYYVGIPDTLHHYARTPLVISTSNDGSYFNKNYIVADQLYALKKAGLWKDGQYGYPHSLVYKNYMYIIISRQKEAIEIIRFKLSQLKQ